MQPRLRLDIGWRDLISVLPPPASVEAASRRIADLAPPDAAVVIGLSVRTLFDALLTETKPAAVAMSAVTIADMATLAQAVAPVRVLDIDPDDLAPDPDAAGPVDMVVVAHLFGRRLPPSILARLGTHADLVVEDCAQAFDGRLDLSPGADVALYSFGPIKTASALGGGVALFRDAGLADRVRRRLAAYPVLSDAWFLRRALKYGGLKILSWPPLYSALLRAIALSGRDPDAVVGGMARGFGGGEPLSERIRRRPPARLVTLMARRLRRWRDPAPDRSAMSAFVAALPPVVPGRGAEGRWWVAPVLSPQPTRLISVLRAAGLDATRGATSLQQVGDAADAPRAERLMAQMVYLPKPRDRRGADRLARHVRAAMEDR